MELTKAFGSYSLNTQIQHQMTYLKANGWFLVPSHCHFAWLNSPENADLVFAVELVKGDTHKKGYITLDGDYHDIPWLKGV